jgi:CRP/FNR family transcriptional regulator, nitrogen oxide reductase regulator
MSETDLAILASSELLRGAPRQILEDARAAASRRRYEAGQTLVAQGDPAAHLHTVIGGRVRLVQTTEDGRQIIIRYVGHGELVGFAVLAGQTHSPITAEAVEITHTAVWSRDAIVRLMERHSALAMNAVAIVTERYGQLQTRLRELSTENVERRLARTLVRLTEEAARRTARGLEIAFPLSRQDLAELSGTGLHTASRTLSGWEDEGTIESGRRRVVVRQLDALREIAGLM